MRSLGVASSSCSSSRRRANRQLREPVESVSFVRSESQRYRKPAYTLDWTKAAELAFHVSFVRLVAKACDNQCLESIAANERIFGRLICIDLVSKA